MLTSLCMAVENMHMLTTMYIDMENMTLYIPMEDIHMMMTTYITMETMDMTMVHLTVREEICLGVDQDKIMVDC